MAGYVSHEGNSVPAHAQLAYPTAEGADALARTRLSRSVAETDVGARGFFQLVGVPPGTYQLIVSARGFATKVVYPVRVYKDAETKIAEPVRLLPPLSFSLAITPARTSTDQPWRVSVRALGVSSAVPINAHTNPQGMVAVEKQAPGRFETMVFDELDNPLDIARFEVTNDGQVIPINIDFVHVSGTLSRGTDTVSAELYFGGRQGAPRVTAHCEKGVFHADLPHAGKWSVDVVGEDFSTTLESVITPNKDGKAEIALRIPLNDVSGKVMDEAGRPVARARVMLSAATTLMTDSGEDGAFSFKGVSEGEAQIVAFDDRSAVKRQTAAVRVVVHDDSRTEPVFLRLLPALHVVGRVQSPYGVVAGAVVTITSSASDSPVYESATTGIDGGFEANIPAPLQVATAIVAAPGFAFRAFAVPLDGRTIVLNVPLNGGTLHIHHPEGAEQLMLLVMQDGLTLPLVDLMRWVRSQPQLASMPGILTIGNMSSGVYKACVARQEAPVVEEAKCRQGVLAPGGELELSPGL